MSRNNPLIRGRTKRVLELCKEIGRTTGTKERKNKGKVR